MLTIGVDIGGTTGIAVVRDGEFLSSAVHKLKGKRPERLTRLRTMLIETITNTRKRAQFKNIDIDIIQYETPFCISHKGYGTLCMYAAIIEQVADEFGIAVRGIDNRTIKKAMVGKGNCTKEDMALCALALSGKTGILQDEADAILVAFYGQEV